MKEDKANKPITKSTWYEIFAHWTRKYKTQPSVGLRDPENVATYLHFSMANKQTDRTHCGFLFYGIFYVPHKARHIDSY